MEVIMAGETFSKGSTWMSGFNSKPTRGAFVRGIIMLPALATLVTESARADDSKVAQSAVQYQTKPNGDKQCSKCAFFIPGATADANGTCKIVDGVISPNGYCTAFNAKQ
jgi:High potential iron-sulfur protein